MIFDETYGVVEINDRPPDVPEHARRNSLTRNASRCGWLQKQSNNLLQKWSYRYLILNNHSLYYFSLPTDPFPLGTINFDQVSIILSISPKNSPTKLQISFKNNKEKLSFQSENSEDIQSWASALAASIKTSKGKAIPLLKLSLKSKFWKFERISEKDFIEMSDTGDILLFRNENIGSRISRGVIGSDYDHVALVIKYISGKVGIFESTSDNGVAVLDWDEYISNDWHKLSSRLVYRQLKVEKTDEMMIKLQEFVEKTEGKGFSISPGKLLQRSSREMPGEEKNFFCSELVASGYKAMGILTSEISASYYWPGDFSASKPLQLINAQLGREMQIDFDLD